MTDDLTYATASLIGLYFARPLMMTLSNGSISALLALCEGNPPVTGGSPSQRPLRGSLMFSLISAGTNGWANTRDAGGLRRHCAHYDVTLTYMKNESSLSIYPILWHCFICMILSIKKALTFHILKTSKFWPSDFTTDDILQSEWNPGTKH